MQTVRSVRKKLVSIQGLLCARRDTANIYRYIPVQRGGEMTTKTILVACCSIYGFTYICENVRCDEIGEHTDARTLRSVGSQCDQAAGPSPQGWWKKGGQVTATHRSRCWMPRRYGCSRLLWPSAAGRWYCLALRWWRLAECHWRLHAVQPQPRGHAQQVRFCSAPRVGRRHS